MKRTLSITLGLFLVACGVLTLLFSRRPLLSPVETRSAAPAAAPEPPWTGAALDDLALIREALEARDYGQAEAHLRRLRDRVARHHEPPTLASAP